MFRVFLKNKILAGSDEKRDKSKSLPPSRRNRRIFERYSVDHKHLMLMNEQDILLVREISSKGFSTEVSKRTQDRLAIGDIYDARIRYLGEIYDLEAKVSWKSGKQVGFEITKTERNTLQFLRRLLHPIEIASSLREVNSSFMLSNEERKTWFHGDNGTDLYLWRSDDQKLTAWQLVLNERFIEWHAASGLKTGTIAIPSQKDVMFGGGGVYGTIDNKDAEIDSGLRQTAVDLFMAMSLPVKDELMATLVSVTEST